MSSEWPKLTLKQAGISLIDCDHRTPAETKSGYPYVSIPQLRDGRIVIEDARRISTEDFLEWTRKAKPKANDVVLSRRCNPGESAYVADGVQFALGQNLVILRSDGIHVHPPFLRWLTRGSEWWRQVETYMNVGAVFTSLKCADIPKFELTIPSIDEQRRIADVLKALDDKIDLNRRINQTLEAMAQAIFKSWFVDFDPVKAKIAAIEQGQDPLRAAMRVISGKSDVELDQMSREEYDSLAATAALFPEEMQESELGEIPKGWGFRQISQFGEVVCGKTPAKNNPDYFGSGTPFIKIPDMHNNVYVTQPVERLTVQGVASQPKKTIPPGSICVSCIATVGKVVLVHEPSQTNQQINSIIPHSLVYSFYLYFQMLENQQNFVDLASGGSATLNMNTSTFSKVEVLMPNEGVIIRFNELVAPIFSQILANQKQADSLMTLRDTLLPKLLSGELSVADFEIALEDTKNTRGPV